MYLVRSVFDLLSFHVYMTAFDQTIEFLRQKEVSVTLTILHRDFVDRAGNHKQDL